MRKSTSLVRCGRITAGQYAILTQEQALGAGLTYWQIRHLLSNGTWKEILPKVYRVAGSPESYEQRIVAACLWADGVASHRCAAGLWCLDGCRRGKIEIVTTRRMWDGPGIRIHRVASLPDADVASVRGIPTTSPARTILDLCGCLGFEDAEVALESALRRRLTKVQELSVLLGPRGRRGASLLRRLLKDRPAGYVPVRSALEVRVRRALLKARLPPPLYEFPVETASGLILHPDFAYPHRMVAIECQSYEYHSGREAWHRDIERRRLLREMGWLVIEVTDQMLREDPESFSADVRSALRSRRGHSWSPACTRGK